MAKGSLPSGKSTFILSLSGVANAGDAGATIDRVRMEEDQTAGQLIASYTVEAMVAGAWQPFSQGITVGAKRIDVRARGPVTATALRFTAVSGFGVPTGLTLFAFGPSGCATEHFEYPL